MLTDAGGIPIVAKTTAANRHDVTELLNLVNEVPAIKGKPGAPRYRFDELLCRPRVRLGARPPGTA